MGESRKHWLKLKVLSVPVGLICCVKNNCPEKYFGNRTEILPLFERDGWYYCRERKICWLECGGRAWEYDIGTFKYELQYLTALERPFTREQAKAMATLSFRCSRKDKIYKDYLNWHQAEQCRETYHESCKYRIQMLKNLANA